MNTDWLKKFRRIIRLISQTRNIHDNIHAMARETPQSQYYEENKKKLLAKLLAMIETFQGLLASDESPSHRSDDDALSSHEVNFSLAELLVFFRRTIIQLQDTPPQVQDVAINILYSYFIELQGLYDLIFLKRYEIAVPNIPLSPATIDDHQKRYLSLPPEIETDPVIREYKSIPYRDLMNVSLFHHLHVVLMDLLPHFLMTALKELLQGKPDCRRRVSPESIHTVDQLRATLAQYPLTETAKLAMAIHRHVMRMCDILFTHCVLRLGRPLFELLILATWIQTVKDHIIPGGHNPLWDAHHFDMEQEVPDKYGNPGKIKLSSAFFMQPRIAFRLERFLIFKMRTMTVGDIVRVTEFGNWMRQHSPDEFLQFFNIARGDLGGLGIRTIPEHEVTETPESFWLYTALMSFIPGGMTSPGSVVMRKSNYGLSKVEQLLQEMLYYDPRFKHSSGLITDLSTILKSVLVLNQGRVGKALERTESFAGRKRGF